MSSNPFRILFCDYDGEFRYSDSLSKAGYLVDEIRSDALRQVSVGDHQVYLFSFESNASMEKAFKTCEKLKAAELHTPIVLLNFGPTSPVFFNHKQGKNAADIYISTPNSENQLLDALDSLVGCQIPTTLRGSFQIPADDMEARKEADQYQKRIEELSERLEELEQESTKKAAEALEAQRNFFKPKLKALLEGQKTQLQTETESLKFDLSEMQAKLLDRELRLKELETWKAKQDGKIEELVQSHEKAQKALREFYQAKLKSLETKSNSDSDRVEDDAQTRPGRKSKQ